MNKIFILIDNLLLLLKISKDLHNDMLYHNCMQLCF